MDEQYTKLLKKQTFWLKLTAFFMGGILMVAVVAAVILVPRTVMVLERTEHTLEGADAAVTDLAVTANKLSRVDFEGLVNDTQKLVEESSEGIQTALGKLDAIDIEQLNEAIGDLSAVIAPLAKLFGR